MTQLPEFFQHLDNDLFFVDCPGLEDQDRLNEYPNQTAIHFIYTKARGTLFLSIFSPGQLTVNRGAAFVTQLTATMRYLKLNASKTEMEKTVIPILVKYKGNHHQKKVNNHIENIKNLISGKHFHNVEDYKDMFNGP